MKTVNLIAPLVASLLVAAAAWAVIDRVWLHPTGRWHLTSDFYKIDTVSGQVWVFADGKWVQLEIAANKPK